MAQGPQPSLFSGSERLFAELAIDVERRDPHREKELVCLMDGERKLWDLQSQWLGRSVEILDFFHVLTLTLQKTALGGRFARLAGCVSQ